MEGGKRAPPFRVFRARRPLDMGDNIWSVGLVYLSGYLNGLGSKSRSGVPKPVETLHL